MPVSDMIRLGTVEQLTPQQLADLALEADREARRYVREGDLVRADKRECGQCEGTGTITGGLSGDGDDEECPVCDGSGRLPEED